jgi:hypothetical protein
MLGCKDLLKATSTLSGRETFACLEDQRFTSEKRCTPVLESQGNVAPVHMPFTTPHQVHQRCPARLLMAQARQQLIKCNHHSRHAWHGRAPLLGDVSRSQASRSYSGDLWRTCSYLCEIWHLLLIVPPGVGAQHLIRLNTACPRSP